MRPGERLVVVGGDAAGMTAASMVRRLAPEAAVMVVERGSYTSYSACGIPYYVGGEIASADDLVVRGPDAFREAGIDVRMRTEAVAVDAVARRVRLRDLGSGAEADEGYDRLLWAAGAHPVAPPVPGVAEHGHVVHTLDEGAHLRAHLERRGDVGRVVVIGAGYIGIEVAEALVRHGAQATLVDQATQVMSTLDADMAAHVEDALTGFGVRVALGERLLEVRGDHDAGALEVVTSAGTNAADVVVVAVGARPNAAPLADAGCEVTDGGALVVDAGMRTTVDGIWAAGDCVASRHVITGAAVNVQLGTHANKQGKIAGLTLCGREAAFPGVVGTAVTKVCDTEIARTGLSEREAAAAGLNYEAVVFTGTAMAGYMPDPGEVFVKMLAERGSGRLLGAQVVGSGNVGKRIDAAATWCQLGVGVAEIQLLDLAYAPPFGGVWDLLQVGARKLVRALDLEPQL